MHSFTFTPRRAPQIPFLRNTRPRGALGMKLLNYEVYFPLLLPKSEDLLLKCCKFVRGTEIGSENTEAKHDRNIDKLRQMY